MREPVRSWVRFLPVAALLLGTTLLLSRRYRAEVVPPRMALADFPVRLGDWSGEDIPLTEEVLNVLGPGDYLERMYQQRAGGPQIDLFLAYVPTQRTGDTVHSPKHCLPGGGWTPVESSRAKVEIAGRPVLLNRYVIAHGDERQLVLYWYQAHGRTLASEYWVKFYLIADAIRLNRTDGSLVRIITPIQESETTEQAEARAIRFAALVVPLLNRYIPV
jgi:EpsI family protein